MTDSAPVLASDGDRERAVSALRGHCVEGRLTLEELSERVEAAYGARSVDELEAALSGLPAVQAQPRTRPKRLTLAAFGRFIRRGRWRVPRRTTALSVFGDVDLDLRDAHIETTAVAVSIFAFFGNVDVYVPEGVEVDIGGLVFFGHRREWGRDVAGRAAPLVRIRALALFGTVDVWRVPKGMTGTYREVIAAVRKRQRELPA